MCLLPGHCSSALQEARPGSHRPQACTQSCLSPLHPSASGRGPHPRLRLGGSLTSDRSLWSSPFAVWKPQPCLGSETSPSRPICPQPRGGGWGEPAGRPGQVQVPRNWSRLACAQPSPVPRYIENPLLLDGKKFDVRSYLLIACAMPYMVFFGHGYARLTLRLYDPHSQDLSGHLTNQVRVVPAVLGRGHGSEAERRGRADLTQTQRWSSPRGCCWHHLSPSATTGHVTESPAPTHRSVVPSGRR